MHVLGKELKTMAQSFDKNQIRSFLLSANYAKYNLYPGLTVDDLCEYSLKLLTNSYNNGKLFIAQSDSEIQAIISFKALDWDSQHFGFKCAIIDQHYYNQNIDHGKLALVFNEMISDVIDYANSENVRFISISVNSWDTFISNILQSYYYKYILTWIDGVFIPSGKLPNIFPDHEIGLIKEEEVAIYQKIAENNYFDGGRFYLDERFDISRVRKMYPELVASSYKNDDIMLSYRISGEPVGLFVCKKIQKFNDRNDVRIAPLRFLVISNEIRKRHLGQNLFSGTLNYLMDISDVITTGLEVHNLASLNLHSKLNFKFNYTHNVFHWWNS
jgi:hypothetical protein